MPFLQEQDAAFVRTRLAQDLRDDVTLEFFAPATGGLVLPGEDGQTAEYARQILAEVAALSPKIRLNVHSTIAEPDSSFTDAEAGVWTALWSGRAAGGCAT